MRPPIQSLLLAAVVVVLAATCAVAAGICSLSASPIDFGRYNPLDGTPARSLGTITYRCLGRPPAGIKIILSTGHPTAAGVRVVSAGSAHLPYLLCLDPSCHEPWGDGRNGTMVYFDSSPPLDKDVTIHVYGLVPRRQPALANREYRDTVAVIAEF